MEQEFIKESGRIGRARRPPMQVDRVRWVVDGFWRAVCEIGAKGRSDARAIFKRSGRDRDADERRAT